MAMGGRSRIAGLADYIQGRLADEKVIIQRYDAYSTSSIYLKLDCGVCNNIRISDHRGKKHLKYRYNIGSWIKQNEKIVDVYDRYYYAEGQADELVRKIMEDRGEKIARYGWAAYHQFVRKSRIEHMHESGFWSKSYYVR